jgi:uracil-DNA glycosylase family 4
MMKQMSSGLSNKEEMERLNREIISCRKCPRLVHFRESLRPRKSFSSMEYWRKPVPGYGDINAELVIIGLAPAPHGGNRTGRIFTGDESARFLVRNLFVSGFSNKPTSEHREDGLELKNCYMTAAVKCAPPDNKPTKEEFENCFPYLERELSLLNRKRLVITLGQLAFSSYLKYAEKNGENVRGMKFVHGKLYRLKSVPSVISCYHPSPRNTYTGKLTEKMMQIVLNKAKKFLDSEIAQPP